MIGEEGLLADRVVSRAVSAAGPDTAVHEVVGGELTPDLLAEIASPSLFAEPRLLVIRALQDLAKDMTDVLVAVVEDDGADVALVAVHAGGVKGKAVLEALKGVGANIVPVPKLTSVRDREQFVVDEVKQAGGRIDREAAVDLVASIGTDLRELATA